MRRRIPAVFSAPSFLGGFARRITDSRWSMEEMGGEWGKVPTPRRPLSPTDSPIEHLASIIDRAKTPEGEG